MTFSEKLTTAAKIFKNMIAKQVISYLHRDERMLHMDELERELQLELERVQKIQER